MVHIHKIKSSINLAHPATKNQQKLHDGDDDDNDHTHNISSKIFSHTDEANSRTSTYGCIYT